MREHFCRVYQDFSKLKISILIGYREDRKVFILNGNKYSEFKEHSVYLPTLEFDMYSELHSNQMLVALVDGLIDVGIKPTKKVINTNEMTAVKYHLEDLRKIVFKSEQTV